MTILDKVTQELGKLGVNLSANPKDIQLLLTSGLFDADYYRETAKIDSDAAGACEHYLRSGERTGLCPSATFDPRFYNLLYVDVRTRAKSALLHYVKYGRSETRYPSRLVLSKDAHTVRQCALALDPTPASNLQHYSEIDLSIVELCLVSWRDGSRLIKGFDDDFYWRVYGDVRAYGHPPVVHFVKVGSRQKRIANNEYLNVAIEAIRPAFDVAHYNKSRTGIQLHSDPVAEYLLYGSRNGWEPSPNYNPEFYLRYYLDLLSTDIDGFHHFVMFGQNEKRIGKPAYGKITRTSVRIDDTKPTILIANHQASRTGAPLVGLGLCQALSAKFNVVVYCDQGGDLVPKFMQHAVWYVEGPHSDLLDVTFLLRYFKEKMGVSAVVMNSIECAAFAKPAVQAELPSVTLMHEFAEYTFPKTKLSRVLTSSDKIVVPSRLIQKSIQNWCVEGNLSNPQNIYVRPQGHLVRQKHSNNKTNQKISNLSRDEIYRQLGISDEEDCKVILGAGFLHIRKGVDTFIQVAEVLQKICRHKVRFVWVGAGYDPERDASYSIWIRESVRRMKLDDVVRFFPEQQDIYTFLDVADVFFLSSRLDPYPNVVLDALSVGKRVVCFQEGTGIADLFLDGDADGKAVPYGDVNAAAAAISSYLDEGRYVSEKNIRLVSERFNFSEYASFVGDLIGKASAEHRRLLVAVDNLDRLGCVDEQFAAVPFEAARTGKLPARITVREYVAASAKGQSEINPRPGFSENLYRSRFAQGGVPPLTVPLEDMLARTINPIALPMTHTCKVLDGFFVSPATPLRALVHIHLHYPDLAGEFLSRIKAVTAPLDLLITVTSERAVFEAQDVFAEYEGGLLEVKFVPNKGRDIGPFVLEACLRERMLSYDIVGHFHSKKSSATDSEMGDRWRNYLLDILLSSADELLALFSEEPKCGLIFAEDRHNVGWGKNREIALQLFPPEKSKVKLDLYPIFPLGTMFWARPAALIELCELKLTLEHFPEEPVPYDGTILHAIERVLPSVCEAAGMTWQTVYKRGLWW